MINYTVNCQLVILDVAKAEELNNYLATKMPLNIDNLGRSMLWMWDYYQSGDIPIGKQMGFWETVVSQSERDEIWETIKTYKQYCLLGDNIEAQIIQKFDTGSPTFGSPLYNIVFDKWGMDC
jgi:hypothetical protein